MLYTHTNIRDDQITENSYVVSTIILIFPMPYLADGGGDQNRL